MPDQFSRWNMSILRGTSGGGGARYLITPAMTGVPAVGVVLTSCAGAWGIAADLIAANAITTDFWICGFYYDTAGAAQVTELQVGIGAAPTTNTIWTERLNPSAVTMNMGLHGPPFPIYCPANSEISARTGGAAAKVLGVSTLYTVIL